MTNSFTTYSRENGGRVILLFLLFCLAIYEFIIAGFSSFAIICFIPLFIPAIYIIFKWRMTTFWLLIIINYIIQWKDSPTASLPIPMSLPNEMLELLLIAIAIIDIRHNPHFEKTLNVMLLAILIWCSFCTLEILNDTCGLGLNIGAWYTEARLMAFQILYIFLVFSLYISSPEILLKYIKVWALLSLFSAIWTWKQQNIGLTSVETSFMYGQGRSTHVLQAGTLLRYFSTFSDAATYGCNAAASSVAFLIFGLTSRFKIDKLFFLLIGTIVIINMFASGTRTAIFCIFAGVLTFIALSKSLKIAIPSAIAGVLFLFILMFTNIGQGNQQIRRMRSAFNKDDASSNVRAINQATMKKYMKDAPWGIGIGNGNKNVPANNKYNRMATIATDSEYVDIFIKTGRIGITIFIITMLIMLGGACYIVLFKLKSPSLIGIGGGLCSAFVAIQVGAYANQILLQFPNGVIFYGGLTIVYILPYLEPAWIKLEEKRILEQERRKKIKLEKKLAKGE